jgi:pimeloyl-ACP methyl ester carboxylesterase
MKYSRLNRFIDNAKFIFSGSSNISKVKEKYNYLKSDIDLLTPIMVNGSNSDVTRTRINNSITNPFVGYVIGTEQAVQLYNISNQDLSSKMNNSNYKIWIITHGFADSFSEDFKLICKNLVETYPDDLILGLDWSTIANGLSPALSLDVYKAATWLKPISEAVIERLSIWGLKEMTQVNLIGHSLGSILASELSLRYIEKYAKKVNNFIALDPPSEITANRYQGDIYLTQLNPLITRINSFSDVADNSIAFVGYNSIAGNEKLASTAASSYLVKFNDIREFRNGHYWVVQAFQKFLEDGLKLESSENLDLYLVRNKLISTDNNPNSLHKATININIDTLVNNGKKNI